MTEYYHELNRFNGWINDVPGMTLPQLMAVATELQTKRYSVMRDSDKKALFRQIIDYFLYNNRNAPTVLSEDELAVLCALLKVGWKSAHDAIMRIFVKRGTPQQAFRCRINAGHFVNAKLTVAVSATQFHTHVTTDLLVTFVVQLLKLQKVKCVQMPSFFDREIGCAELFRAIISSSIRLDKCFQIPASPAELRRLGRTKSYLSFNEIAAASARSRNMYRWVMRCWIDVVFGLVHMHLPIHVVDEIACRTLPPELREIVPLDRRIEIVQSYRDSAVNVKSKQESKRRRRV